MKESGMQTRKLNLKWRRRATDHAKRLLISGPCTTAEELMVILHKKPSQAEFIVKTEIAYYANTHKDKMQRQKLDQQNSICHDEKMENLLILSEVPSSTDEVSTATVANFPSNKDVLTSLSQTPFLSTKAYGA